MKAEKKIEIVPFIADENEHQAVNTLPTNTVTTEALANAVPKLQEWTLGKLFTEFGVKDGTLIYHFYHSDRKAIFDIATNKMNERLSAEDKQSVAETANAALEEIPWWPDMQLCIAAAIEDYFREIPASVKYVPEVDSWSVVMPIEAMSLGMQSPGHIAAFILGVAHRLRQAGRSG